MRADAGTDFHLEIGHVLFVDIVGYSKLLSSEQRELFALLNDIVRNSQQFSAAEADGKLVRLPTGDGMVLVFLTSVDMPVRCAQEVSRKLREHPELKLRMGINSGPVDQVSDVNDQRNVTGVGINMAERVMDCGDGGHILLSKRVADDLAQYSEWQPYLHELGDVEVKHGVHLSVVNFYADGVGNATVPDKIARRRAELETAAKRSRRRRRVLVAAAAGVSALVIILSALAYQMRKRLGEASAIPEKSVAILPFENLSADPNNELFVVGVEDEILTRAAKIASLKVISRTSTQRYEPRPANLREVAKQLGVAHLLEGSVQKIQNKVHVNVQLIKVANDAHVWAESYDRELTDVFAVEAEIASRIANSLNAAINPEEKKRVAAIPTTNPDAYEAYLQGREMRIAPTSYSPENGAKEREHYERAIALDPEFALAHARLSEWYSKECVATGGGCTAEGRLNARREADEALRLQPDLGESHKALGWYYYGAERDYAAADKEFAIGLQTLPNDVELIMIMSLMERRRGHWRAAIAGLQHAQSLDPRNVPTINRLAGAYFAVRDYAAAEETRRKQVEVASTYSPQAAVIAKLDLCYLQWIRTGNLAPMQSLLDQLPQDFDRELRGLILGSIGFAKREPQIVVQGFDVADDKQDPLSQFFKAQALLVKGDTSHANEILDGLIPTFEANVKKNPSEAQFHSKLGLFYAYRDRKDEAIREGRRAVELLPENKDAVVGPFLETFLAMIYARVGNQEASIDLIEHLLTIPCEDDLAMTKRELQVGWSWDPLRQNPRFQKILASPAPKTTYN